MALQHAASGERIALHRDEQDIAHFTSVALAKTANMELIRLVLPKGRSMPSHKVDGELTLLCLEGAIAVDAHGRSTTLHPGQMLYLIGGEPHALNATEDAVALLTILLPAGKHGASAPG
jgi:quercetin dioxygenase-like cupin family protein